MSELLYEMTNVDSAVKRTVEVVGETTRRCKKCKAVVAGELRDFRWDEARQVYFAWGWQMPSGWSHYIYTKSDGSGPWQAHLCPGCTAATKDFIGGE